jgi:hypothetical protein
MKAFPIPVRAAEAPPQRPARALERAAVALRPYLPWVHAAMALGFLTLIAGPVWLPGEAGSELGRLANWLIWALWFPLVFMSVLLVGRSWCGLLCPMGAASQWMNRIGLKRPIPAWLRWEGTPIVSFVLVTVLGQTVGVRDYADAVFEVFGGTLLAALAIGFVYGRGQDKRAWCRHACPIGLLLGVFSRLGAVDLRPKRAREGDGQYTDKGLCPTLIDINRKTESRHCIMCMRCVQPGHKGGLELRLRPPGEEIAQIDRHHPVASELWFLFLGTGVALGGFLWLVLPEYQALRQALGVWAIDHGMYWIGTPGPGWLMSVHPTAREVFNWLDFFLISGWMLGVMALFAAMLGLANAAAAALAGGVESRRVRFVRLGYQFAPVSMVSLLLGLGGDLFGLLPGASAGVAKTLLLLAAVAWSVWLAGRILRRLGARGWRFGAALVPGTLGILAVAWAWWPALSG